MIPKDRQYYKFCAYGFLKNLQFFDPFILLFLRSTGLSYLQIGTLFTIREAATMVLEVPTGLLADWFGRKNAMLCSFTSYIIAFVLFYAWPRYAVYALAMLFYGFGEAFRTGTHKAMILDYLKLQNILHLKTDYYGHTRSWSQTGSALSALIAGGLVFLSGGYRIVFLASIVPYFLGLALIASYPRELNGLNESTGQRRDHHPGWRDFIAIFRHSSFHRAVLNSALYDGLYETVKDYLQPILKHFALALPIWVAWRGDQRSAAVIAVTYCGIYLLTAWSSRNAGRLARKCRSLPGAVNLSFLLGTLITGFSGLLVFTGVTSAAIGLFILLYMFHNLRRPLNIAAISETIPAPVMATGLSVESQFKTLTTAVLAPLMGYLADRMGIGPAIVTLSLLLAVIFPLIRLKSMSHSTDSQGELQ